MLSLIITRRRFARAHGDRMFANYGHRDRPVSSIPSLASAIPIEMSSTFNHVSDCPPNLTEHSRSRLPGVESGFSAFLSLIIFRCGCMATTSHKFKLSSGRNR